MKRLIILTLAIGAFVADATAQDDLYFVPTKKNVEKSAAEYGIPADTYYAGCGKTVDDYNRRMSTVQPIDSAGNDIITFDGVKGVYPSTSADDTDDYRYTRSMSRFDGYDWYEPYWAGYADGRFDSWGSYSYWAWDYPYYGYRSWYWGYPYTYYSSWYWDRPWYGGGWYGHYRPYYGGYTAYSRPNGVRRFSRSDFRGERTGNNSTATRRNFGGSTRDFRGQRVTTNNGTFSGQRNINTNNNMSINRQSSSFNGSSTFSGARGGASFGGARGGGGGGARGGITLGGRR